MHCILALALCFIGLLSILTPTLAIPSQGLGRRTPAPTLEARYPRPSAARRNEARSPRPSGGFTKREQTVVVSPEEKISQQLCPMSLSVCPLDADSFPTNILEWIHDGFECVDLSEDLTSCGGCGTTDIRYDCTTISHSRGVSCVSGRCRVNSCAEGYIRSLDGKSCIEL